MKFRWMILLLAALIASPAFAHGDKKHVIGTIAKISTESVIVKTEDGKSVEVKLAPTTAYVTKEGKPAKFADVAVGQTLPSAACTPDHGSDSRGAPGTRGRIGRGNGSATDAQF